MSGLLGNRTAPAAVGHAGAGSWGGKGSLFLHGFLSPTLGP